ncbi:beta strand repeat-containing protein [Marinomonas fungiae]|uniref:Uncharacterized protein n=1 Tax=Marinomonas fungiae TaxID=1137284 RepID=A0A0K6IHH1_9GAMM|nr:hypothetical protein [Marinomonas fungiae]CUB02767.1 hypothetical protein Ga0061065_102104 [Marinomonas fungiae]
MAISQQQRTDLLTLVVGMFDAAPTSELLSALATGLNDGATLDQYAANLGNSSEFGALYPSYLTVEEFSARFITNLLGGNTSEQAVADGAQFVTDLINAGFSTGQAAYEAIKAIAAAPQDDAVWGAAAAELNNKVAVADYFAVNGDYAGLSLEQMQLVTDGVTADSATVDAKKAEIDNGTILGGSSSAEGTEFFLTTATDAGSAFRGTSAADVYYADLGQNSFAGGISNTLSSADRLDGQGDYDSLFATLVPEFYGVTGDNTVAVMPKTANIEEVMINARDVFSTGQSEAVFGSSYTDITLDAQLMTDIQVIGSSYSNGDLIIDNLTTLTANGSARNTAELTVVMDHTAGSDNVTSDRSDLTVYIDEDYLITDQTTGGAGLVIRMLNAFSNVEGGNPVEGYDVISFTVGETAVNVDITDIATNSALDYTTAYAAVVDAINAQLAAQGLSTVTAAINATEPAVFSIPVGSYTTGNSAGVYYPITLTNTGSEALAGVEISQSTVLYDTDMNNSFNSTAASTVENPLSINIELDKVGRDADGGDLTIGAKDQTSGPNNNTGTDVDQTDGIEVFYIDVRGDESRPSNLGTIKSTNGALTTVYVKNDETDFDGASLTVRNLLGEGQELELIDASAFTGDFSLAMSDLTGQQAVTSIFGSGNDSYNWSSSEEDSVSSGKAYSISMGEGDDTVTANLDGDSVDAVGESFTLSMGAGDDTATLTGTTGVSDATVLALDNVNVDLGSGDDTLYLNTEIITKVNAGSGSDFVVVDADNAEGTGNGEAGEWTLGTGSDSIDGSWNARVLYEATVTVNFAGFQQSLVIPTTAANNFVATQADINAAIIAVIEANPELSRLLSTEVNDGSEDSQQLTITSNVQGAYNLAISINQPTVVAAATAVAGDVTIAPTEYSALEAGLLATGAVADSAVIGTVTPEADLLAVLSNIDGNLDEEGNVAVNLVVNATEGTDNTNATSRAIIDMGTGANDLVVLDTDQDSSDTLVFSDNWDKVSVLNFDAASTAVGGQNEVQTIDVTGVSAGETDNNGGLQITLGTGEVVLVAINTNDDDQAISNAIVAAVNGLGVTTNVVASNVGGTSTTITLIYDASEGNVATTEVAEFIATDATMTQTTTGGAAVAAVDAVAEVTNVAFADVDNAVIGQEIIFDGTTITLADTDGSGAVEVDEIAQQVAAGTYANFTVTDYDYSAGVVQFTANTAGNIANIVAGDFTGSAITDNTTATPGFGAVGTAVTAGQDGVDAAAAVAEGDDVLTFTAADEAGTLSLFVDHDGDATTDAQQIDVALLAGDSAISVATKAAAALDAALDTNWTVTDNADGTVTLAKSAALGAVESTTYVDGAVDTAIADALTVTQGQTGSGITLAGDTLDFTAWLDDQTSTSGSTESAITTATTVSVVSAAANLNLGSNEVVIINDFAQDISGSLNETWALLDAADIDAALEGSTAAYGNFLNGGSTAVADPTNLVGTGISSILMVENDQNAGEYKVFSVETNAAAADGSEFTVEMLGVIDFGAEQTALTAANFA